MSDRKHPSRQTLPQDELRAFAEALLGLGPSDRAVVISVLQHIRAIALSQGELAAEAALDQVVAALSMPLRPLRDLQEEPRAFLHALRLAEPQWFKRDSTSRHSMACSG